MKRGVIQGRLFFDPRNDIVDELNNVVRESQWDILEFHQEKLSLEDSFILLTQGNKVSDSASTETEEVLQSDKGGAE